MFLLLVLLFAPPWFFSFLLLLGVFGHVLHVFFLLVFLSFCFLDVCLSASALFGDKVFQILIALFVFVFLLLFVFLNR